MQTSMEAIIVQFQSISAFRTCENGTASSLLCVKYSSMYPCTPRYILLARLELHSFSQVLLKDKFTQNWITRFLNLSNRGGVFFKGQVIPSLSHYCPLRLFVKDILYMQAQRGRAVRSEFSAETILPRTLISTLKEIFQKSIEYYLQKNSTFIELKPTQ